MDRNMEASTSTKPFDVCKKTRNGDVPVGHKEISAADCQISELKQPELDVEEEEPIPSIFMQLPQEIWSMILEYVSQKDRIAQRLVNRQWCKAIDDLSTLKIEYNEISPNQLAYVLSLRIRSCQFSGIREAVEPFLHPLLIKEIVFGPNVSAENAKKILCQCTNVESLRCFVTEGSDTAFDASSSNLKYLKTLKKLKTIEIGILFFGRRTPTSVSNTFSSLIGSQCVVFPSLSQITIHYGLSPKEWRQLVYFIIRHSKTLKGLHLSNCICEAMTSLEGVEVTNLRNLSKCQLNLVVVNKFSFCQCRGLQLWANLLSLQNHVQKLCTILVPNTSVISEFVERNEKTLVSLKLEEISLGIDPSMNGSVFENCLLLQELQLHFECVRVIVVKASDCLNEDSAITNRCAEFYGLQLLPKSLRKLNIAGCYISSSNLIEMSSKLVNLQELHLGDPGSPSKNEYGVTMKVLLNLIRNLKDLRKLKVHNNFVNKSSESEKMWQKIYHVFQKHGLITNSLNVQHIQVPVKNRIVLGHKIEFWDSTIDLNLNALDRSEFLEVLEELDSELF